MAADARDPFDLRPGMTCSLPRHRLTYTLMSMYIQGFAMHTVSSRVFNNGNSQAVRIPAEFRLSTGRVEISRTESGDLLIHPIAVDRGQALLEALQAFDQEFVSALEESVREQLPVQEREAL